jgi:periplasmic protein TonB
MKDEKLKSEKLEKKRTVLFQIGMVVSLTLVLLAFEWRSPKTYIKPTDNFNSEFDAELTDITVQKVKPVMPLPKIAQVFVAVSDRTVLDESIEIEFEDTESGENEPGLFVDFEKKEIVPEDTTIYKYPSSYPEFPGGEIALFSYLSENIKYTKEARGINLQGTVHVSFVVGKDGSITKVKILRGLGAGLDEVVIRVIEAMPSWKPGLQGGKKVNVEYTIPVKFKLNN